MNKESGKTDTGVRATRTGNPEESNWASDQQKHDYYYDDSHGYEVYNPEQEDEESDREDKKENEADED